MQWDVGAYYFISSSSSQISAPLAISESASADGPVYGFFYTILFLTAVCDIFLSSHCCMRCNWWCVLFLAAHHRQLLKATVSLTVCRQSHVFAYARIYLFASLPGSFCSRPKRMVMVNSSGYNPDIAIFPHLIIAFMSM